MPALPTQGMGFHALRLKNASPDAFEGFIKSLTAYRDVLMDELSMAPQQDILNAQGRVQVANALLRTLNECHIRPQKPPSTP